VISVRIARLRTKFKGNPGVCDPMVEYAAGRCNIGPRGRMRRATGGMILLAIALAAAWWLRSTEARDWTLLLFFPLFVAFVSLFEAALGFCVIFAERGVYDLR